MLKFTISPTNSVLSQGMKTTKMFFECAQDSLLHTCSRPCPPTWFSIGWPHLFLVYQPNSLPSGFYLAMGGTAKRSEEEIHIGYLFLKLSPCGPWNRHSWFFLMRATCPAVVTLPHQPFSMGLVTVQLLGALYLITQCGFPWPSPHFVNSPFIKLSSIIPSKSAIWILSGLWTGHN